MYNKKFTSLETEKEIAIASDIPSTQSKDEEASLCSNDFEPDLRLYLALYSLAAGIIVVAVNDGLISTASAVLARELNATAIEMFWNGTGYLLCSAIFQPIYVHISQFFGRKASVIMALLIYLLGTIVGMTARHINAVIASRAMQGVGAGGLVVLTEVIITDLIPLRSRGLWLGIINGAYAVGSANGYIIGGAIVQKANWRWLFYVDLPILGVALITVPLFLEVRLHDQDRDLSNKLRCIDWIGIALFLPSMAIFIAPLTFGGILFPWASWPTMGLLAFGIIGFCCLAMYEDIRAQHHLIDPKIFKNRTVLVTYAANLLLYTVYFSQLYYLPLWLQAIKEYSPLMSGVAFLPFSGVVDVMAIVAGALITATARYSWMNWAGFAALALGVGLQALPDARNMLARWIVPMIVAGLGAGILITSLRLTMQAAVTDEETPSAVAIYSLIRDTGATLGVALGGSIFQNSLSRNLEGQTTVLTHDNATRIARDAASLVPLSASFRDITVRRLVQRAYSGGFRTTWVVMCCFATLGIILSFCVTSYSLNRPRFESKRPETTVSITDQAEGSTTPTLIEIKELGIAEPAPALVPVGNSKFSLMQKNASHDVDIQAKG